MTLKIKGEGGTEKVQSHREQIIEDVLVKNYSKYYCLAYGYVHNEADALDIVQEGAYKAILKADTLRSEEYAETWIYRIMLNEIFGFFRSRKAFFAEEFFGETDAACKGDVCCAEEMDLRDAMKKLSIEEREILKLRYFQGMKLEEISRDMGINLNTLKSRLYRTLEKLRLSMTI